MYILILDVTLQPYFRLRVTWIRGLPLCDLKSVQTENLFLESGGQRCITVIKHLLWSDFLHVLSHVTCQQTCEVHMVIPVG